MGLSVVLVHPHDVWYDPWCVRIVELARALKRSGHSPTVVYFDSGRTPHCRTRLPNDIEFIALSRAKSAYGANRRRLRTLVRNADLMHVQKCWPNACLPALWAAFLEDKPIHYDWDDWETGLTHDWMGECLQTSIIVRWEQALPLLCDTMSVSSQWIRQKAIEYGFAEERIVDASVGADLEMFSPDRDGSEARKKLEIGVDERLVLYSGQLRACVYADQFVRAAAEILIQAPDVKFVVVGSGEHLPEVQRVARSCGIAESIRFTGMIPHEEVPEYLAAADIGVATFEDAETVRAKSPLKIAEYLASGLPVVGSAVGEVPRMIGAAGIVVPPGDYRAVADAVLRILTDPDTMAVLGRVARERACAVYNWDQTAMNLIRAYEIGLGAYG